MPGDELSDADVLYTRAIEFAELQPERRGLQNPDKNGGVRGVRFAERGDDTIRINTRPTRRCTPRGTADRKGRAAYGVRRRSQCTSTTTHNAYRHRVDRVRQQVEPLSKSVRRDIQVRNI